eukprot:CAMPEP_0117584434 /NCGR_PEP_ID=MMETSP0784-20121206/67598_1 /TAXON_ID=39447 /ORGANISM="" /LENGTH=44 /DNA_ID= /DNA_START= /DNA_END= /DNA_ORIENTATION=
MRAACAQARMRSACAPARQQPKSSLLLVEVLLDLNQNDLSQNGL